MTTCENGWLDAAGTPTAFESADLACVEVTPMVIAVLVLLVVLWFLGYVSVPSFGIPDVSLFSINGHVVTLLEGLIFLVLLAAVGILPTPLRQITFVALVLWVLSTLGIVAITGLSSILVIAVIVGLIASLFGLLGRPRETVTVIREDT